MTTLRTYFLTALVASGFCSAIGAAELRQSDLAIPPGMLGLIVTQGQACVPGQGPDYRLDTRARALTCQPAGGGFAWSYALPPSGQPCGFFAFVRSTGAQVPGSTYAACRGHNPRTSCPPGFVRKEMEVESFDANQRHIALCIVP